jgi:hypothetical protein
MIFLGAVSLTLSLMAPIFFFVDCPFYDDWVLMSLIKHLLEGTATFQDFWLPHNEHRVLFPWLFLASLGAWTHWDMRLVPWLDLGLILLAGLLLYRLGSRSVAESPGKVVKDPAFWVVMAFLFSLRATEAVLWTMMLSLYMAITFTVIGIAWLSLKPSSVTRWALTAALGVIASYSFAGGIFIWGAVMPLFWFIRKQRHFRFVFPLWIGVAVLTVFFYFYQYKTPWQHPPLTSIFHEPIPIFRFVLIYLGSIFYSFMVMESATAWFGFMGLVLAMYFFWGVVRNPRKADARTLGMAGILLVVLANAFLTAVARASFGMGMAYTERYVSISCYFWAVLGLVLYTERKRFFMGLLIFLMVSALSASIFHSLILAAWKDRRMENVEVLKEEPMNTAKIYNLYVFADLVEEAAHILKDKKLSFFREKPGQKNEL